MSCLRLKLGLMQGESGFEGYEKSDGERVLWAEACRLLKFGLECCPGRAYCDGAVKFGDVFQIEEDADECVILGFAECGQERVFHAVGMADVDVVADRARNANGATRGSTWNASLTVCVCWMTVPSSAVMLIFVGTRAKVSWPASKEWSSQRGFLSVRPVELERIQYNRLMTYYKNLFRLTTPILQNI
jgi:hypothetical protein